MIDKSELANAAEEPGTLPQVSERVEAATNAVQSATLTLDLPKIQIRLLYYYPSVYSRIWVLGLDMPNRGIHQSSRSTIKSAFHDLWSSCKACASAFRHVSRARAWCFLWQPCSHVHSPNLIKTNRGPYAGPRIHLQAGCRVRVRWARGQLSVEQGPRSQRRRRRVICCSPSFIWHFPYEVGSICMQSVVDCLFTQHLHKPILSQRSYMGKELTALMD